MLHFTPLPDCDAVVFPEFSLLCSGLYEVPSLPAGTFDQLLPPQWAEYTQGFLEDVAEGMVRFASIGGRNSGKSFLNRYVLNYLVSVSFIFLRHVLFHKIDSHPFIHFSLYIFFSSSPDAGPVRVH